MSSSRAVGGVDAAAAQIEDRVLVELADGGAVAALDVVGEDLELRLGVDLRVVGQQQVLVHLLRVALLRVRAHEHLAVEDAGGALVEDALVELAAGAARLAVVDGGVVVDVLRAAGQVEPVERAGGTRRIEAAWRCRCAPAPRRARRRASGRALGGLLDRDDADVKGLGALALHLVVRQRARRLRPPPR